jgi:hypothetical protein
MAANNDVIAHIVELVLIEFTISRYERCAILCTKYKAPESLRLSDILG